MPDGYFDFETRSVVDVGDCGAWKYAAHPSTFPLMFAWLLDDECKQWVHRRHGEECPNWWREVVEDETIRIHAFNANFEIAVYDTICHERWGWPAIDLERWRDTAAKAAHANQPRALANACKRLGVSERKDKIGKELIKKLCEPQKTVKAVKYSNTEANRAKGIVGKIRKDSVTYLTEHGIEVFDHKFPSKAKSAVDGYLDAPAYWNNEPKLMERFEEYNRQDVYAERDVCKALPDFPDDEQRLWVLDSEINARGIPVDREICEGVQKVYAVEVSLCNEELQHVCRDSENDGPKAVVERFTQGKRIKDWLNKYCNFALPTDVALSINEEPGNMCLSKDAIEAFQRKPWGCEHTKPEDKERIDRALELIQIAGGSGVKKYWAATDFGEELASGWYVVRGQLLYYGAATGRWSGKGIQPHNFVRQGWFESPESTPSNRIAEEAYFEVIKSGSHEYVSHLADMMGLTVNKFLRGQVRGLIRAPRGYKLIVSDFAGIEARVLQWMAGNWEVCEKFSDPTWDNYVHTAAGIFDLDYADMMEPDGEGGLNCKKAFKDKRQVGKIAVLALGYGMGAGKYQVTCEGFGVKIDLDFAQEIVTKWRASNPKVVQLWKRVERAAKHVVKKKRGTTAVVDNLRFAWDRRGYLTIQLPSGRKLYYYKARIDRETGGIMYLDGGKSEGLLFVNTYGGKLVENIIQAVSRDLLVYSAFLATADGLNLIFHVHDELVVLAKLNDATAHDRLHKHMSTIPRWATGLPLAAETYSSLRYTK